MTRIRIKHSNPKEKRWKQRLLEILASNEVYVTKILQTEEGFVVLSQSDEDTDKIFNIQCANQLTNDGFTAFMPPELKAKRSVILFRVDDIIYNKDEQDIKEEIHGNNYWAASEVETIFKFPKSNTLKVTFHQTRLAQKAKDTGLLLYNLKIPSHNIKQEEYVFIITCMRCYAIEEHTTNNCPEGKDYIICSECCSTNHIWRNCNSESKMCINCGEEHRTLSMKCKHRKKAVNNKRQSNTPHSSGGTYSGKLKANNVQTQSINIDSETPVKILTCMIHAHLLNIANPGSYGKELNSTLKANNLPGIIVPTNPDSSKIINIADLTRTTTSDNRVEKISEHCEEQTEETTDHIDLMEKQVEEAVSEWKEVQHKKHKEGQSSSIIGNTTKTQTKNMAKQNHHLQKPREELNESATREIPSKPIRGQDLGLEIFTIEGDDKTKGNMNYRTMMDYINKGRLKLTFTAAYLTEDKVYKLLYDDKIDYSSCYRTIDKGSFRKIRGGLLQDRSPPKPQRDPRIRKISM